jgi:hypothetical protein
MLRAFPLAKSSGLVTFGLQPNGTYTCHRRERTAALLLALGLVEIGDAFFGDDMTHIIAIDHYRSEGHACFPSDRYGIQSLNKCRRVSGVKRLHGLHDQLRPRDNGLREAIISSQAGELWRLP